MSAANIDPVTAAIAIGGLIFSPALSDIVGPYAVIVLASGVGAAWSLGRRPSDTRAGAAGYFALICGTAMFVTGGMADLAAQWLGLADSRVLLAPVSLLFGGVGYSWPALVNRAWRVAVRIFCRRYGGGNDSGPNGGTP